MNTILPLLLLSMMAGAQTPDFTLAVNMPEMWTFIDREVAYGVTVTSVNSFSGTIKLEVTAPAGMVVTIFPKDTLFLSFDQPRGWQVNVRIANDAALVKDYTLTFTAVSSEYQLEAHYEKILFLSFLGSFCRLSDLRTADPDR